MAAYRLWRPGIRRNNARRHPRRYADGAGSANNPKQFFREHSGHAAEVTEQMRARLGVLAALLISIAACEESPLDPTAQLDAIIGGAREGGGSYSRTVL